MELNIADLIVQVFGERAIVWVLLIGACLAAWAQLRAAVPQAWWDRLPRPILAVLDVLAANWGSARNAELSGRSAAAVHAAGKQDNSPAGKRSP